MKVVINKCYGGFGLSHEALLEYGRRNGTPLYVKMNDVSAKIHRDVYKHEPSIDPPCCDSRMNGTLAMYYTKPDGADDSCFWKGGIPRDSPALVSLVEEWGARANSAFSELAVIEIPDGVDYEIEEYDGKEWVAEKHRTWG